VRHSRGWGECGERGRGRGCRLVVQAGAGDCQEPLLVRFCWAWGQPLQSPYSCCCIARVAAVVMHDRSRWPRPPCCCYSSCLAPSAACRCCCCCCCCCKSGPSQLLLATAQRLSPATGNLLCCHHRDNPPVQPALDSQRKIRSHDPGRR
jgi:hypothetical protein